MITNPHINQPTCTVAGRTEEDRDKDRDTERQGADPSAGSIHYIHMQCDDIVQLVLETEVGT